MKILSGAFCKNIKILTIEYQSFVVFCPFYSRIDTGQRLSELRSKLRALDLDAFLVPSGDSHQSEYVGRADKRRQWIGGFTGSSGFAVVTTDKAAMWTDGRYEVAIKLDPSTGWNTKLCRSGFSVIAMVCFKIFT